MRKVFLFIALAAMIGTGCKHENTPQPSGAPTPTPNPGPNPNPNPNPTSVDTVLCFQRDILPIFLSNCAMSGCHDAVSKQDGFQFTDYNSIVSKEFVSGNANETELFEKITEDNDDKRMPPPPRPGLTATQIALIKRWINEGAKNTTCSSGCDSTNFKYSSAIKPLTEQYCRGCHNSAAASGGIMLDSYDGVKTVALNGRMLGAIKHLTGYQAMPQGGSKLSDCQILQVEKWIAAGAQNN
ncbi:c-type cytochrome domain-containing protein [Polluticoccus soli]|uniref:c-type cytochrome domain-containing protein n=1 Tax=Polluticoccus soli TaxID=3034150 RepID=UPI0023E287E7|nr:c-type cytochrome domain-containing protein [Flavipsychrobacter sp. JY13-12]